MRDRPGQAVVARLTPLADADVGHETAAQRSITLDGPLRAFGATGVRLG